MSTDETGGTPQPILIVGGGPEAGGMADVGGGSGLGGSAGEGVEGVEGEDQRETVEQPAKVMRIGSMIKQLLDEVRQAPLDEASRSRLKEVYETSVQELARVLSPDLRDELDRLAMPFEEGTPPSESELRVAHAQLVGWLEGLFHGIQATLFAQQMAARAQLEEMRQRAIPSTTQGPDPTGGRPPGYL